MSETESAQRLVQTIAYTAHATVGLLPNGPQYRAAYSDLLAAVKAWPIWLGLGNREIKARYRRTTLGPFWMTFNLGLSIMLVGLVFGTLFNVAASSFVPHLAVSLVVWHYIVALLTDGSRCYIDSANYIKQIKHPLLLYFLMLLWRNILTLFHNILIVPFVFLAFAIIPGPWIVLLPLQLLLVTACLAPYALIAGILSARFRDVPQIVLNVMSALFLATPIVWKLDLLGDKAKFAYLNPFTHLIEIVRTVSFGEPPLPLSVGITVLMAAIGWVVAAVVFARFRSRIAYWV